MPGYLLDTNVISELVKERPDPSVVAWIDEVDRGLLHLSVLTMGELRLGVASLASGRRKARLESWIFELTGAFEGRVIPIDQDTTEIWGELTSAARREGKPAPTLDTLIAATAVRHRLTVVTRNVKDFEQHGIAVENPWTAD